MADKKYIGITIGPIFDTLNLSSSPLALWASSYMFSTLSKTLCKLICENGVDEEAILTPYYSDKNRLINTNDGVGLFPDRIIFDAEGFDNQLLPKIKADAISEISRLFGIEDEYLTKYLAITYIEFFASNPIVESAKIFDSLELSKSFVSADSTNPLQTLFAGNKYSHNSNLTKTELVSLLDEFQLKKSDGTFKSIEDIVATGEKYKKYKYYALVRSDGDNMSKIIDALSSDKIRDFSHTCLKYCAEVAKKVTEYDGITIYSGGDDLLAILPCESQNGRTPFEFAQDANRIFKEYFKEYNQPVSLSFGITMVYKKFPLFEALEDSQRLLFNTAKRGTKNCMAMRLQKNSGQTVGLVVSNEILPAISDFINHVKENCIGKEPNKDILLSAMQKFDLFEQIFNNTDSDEEITNAVYNVFDSDIHKKSDFISHKLVALIQMLKDKGGIKSIEKDSDSKVVSCILRICKFFIEDGGDIE